jgi:hypothetical protein
VAWHLGRREIVRPRRQGLELLGGPSTSPLDRMQGRLSLGRALSCLDALVALAMAAAAVWLFRLSGEAAAEAIRLYGRNVDSGAIESAAAGIYFLPNVVLFALSSIAVWRAWRIRWFLQAGALVWLVVPVVLTSVRW